MASSLGSFLDAMYKKRELEYKAGLAQSEADLAGAKAWGQAFSNIGSAVGSAVGGLGGYMQQSQADKSAMSVAQDMGHPLSTTGFGAEHELQQRMAAGQFKDTSMTPYQTSMVDLRIAQENRARLEGKQKIADAATANQSKQFTQTANDSASYFHNSAANMDKLLDADTPEKFSLLQKNQKALNIAGMKAGVPEDQLYTVPNEFVPKSTEPIGPGYQRYPSPSHGPSIAYNPTSTGIPAGAIPVPGLTGKPGEHTATYNGKPYVWDGNFMVPNPNK